MAIIVEGFDNSGKSTLAASFGLEVIHPGPRPRTFTEEHRCLEEQLRTASEPHVKDRVTAISSPCYTGHLDRRYREYLDAMLSTRNCVLIYCRPPIEVIKDFSRHKPKSYDEAKQIEWLQKNVDKVVKNYDVWMRGFPHVVYDYTNPNRAAVQAAYDAQHSTQAWRLWNSLHNRG